MDEPDVAGITFCFHNKTARCIKRIHDRFQMIFAFWPAPATTAKKFKHTHTARRREFLWKWNHLVRMFTQSADLNKQCFKRVFFQWIRCIQICFRELVKHNKYRYISLSNYANHPKCDATSVYHKFAQIRKTTMKNRREKCVRWKLHVSMEFPTCRPTHQFYCLLLY